MTNGDEAPGYVAGVDEVGRGPLAGPVTAAAVILPPGGINGVTDSKALTALRRSALAAKIREVSVAWALGWADCGEIDAVNIRQATLRAMVRAVEQLQPPPGHVRVDGRDCPPLACGVEAVIGGDRCCAAIGAASIVAKCARDEAMLAYAERHPEYGFERHKGYGTREHLAALRVHGPTPLHRHSYAPVRGAITRLR